MKQVLLAINGDNPTTAVFNYAVDLCTRIRAELNILQFLKERRLTEYLLSTKKKVRCVGRLLEDSFAGVAFAEEGMPDMADEILSGASEPLKKLISNKAGMSFEIALINGSPETDLESYIENHHDIILTIFDPSTDSSDPPGRNRVNIEQIKKKLSVPLVIVMSSVQAEMIL